MEDVSKFLALGAALVFPQLLGILLYFRLSRVPRWVAAIAAALAPAVFFFWFTRLLLAAQFRELYPHGMTCGMPALAAAFLLLAGTVVQLIGGVFTQIILAMVGRRR